MNTRMSNDTIRAALAVIPADDRDLWLQIGMALKSELGDEGQALFEAWSESGASYDAKAVGATWKSFKSGGSVTMATLVYEAKQRGFDPKQHAPAVPLSAADKARIQEERAARDKAAAEELAAKQACAAAEAAQLWEKAKLSGKAPYLESKGVSGLGVRYTFSAALIPLADVDGKLWNVQRIFSNGDKYFLAGGRVSGCFHVIGDIASSAWLLIAEGYATAATLHQATGYAVVVAFNESNVRHVAAAMRKRHPTAKLLMCADDDQETATRTGKNPGLVAAAAAAKAINGLWCKPEGLPAEKTDFNDLATASGIDVVRQQIDAATAAVENNVVATAPPSDETSAGITDTGKAATEPTAITPKGAEADKQKQPRKGGATTARKPRDDGGEQSRRAFFTVDDGGVWFHGFDQRGEPMSAVWICSEMHITAMSRDASNGDWGYLLEFTDADGKSKHWVMPSTMLAGDGTQYRATLLGMGLRIGAGMMAKTQLTVYIQSEKTERRVRCTDRTGWHDGVYVMPDRTIGNGGEEVVFQAAGGVVSQFKQRGTLADWRDQVAVHCRGNTRMLFCVSVAFAAPLLHLARMPSGGFHLWGDSSSGKSTAFKVAGSVFGGKDYPRSWKHTDNSLETVAVQHCDTVLLLDEIAQVDPKVVGDIVYMLSNEAGKGRATQTAGARKVATWRLLFLSDGEISLANHMEQAGKGTKAGHDVRMAHIPADAGKGLGVYETLNSFSSGAALSDHLVRMAHQHYGNAGMAFIEFAVQNADMLTEVLEQDIKVQVDAMCPPNSHGQVSRVAARFALVGLAGELASSAGITGWDSGEATQAARVCFAAWLDGRGGAGNVEQVSILRQVTGFFQAHGDSRFTWWHRALDDRKPNTINRAGFKRMLTKDGAEISSNSDHHREYGDAIHPSEAQDAQLEYFVLPEVFRTEVCKGYSVKAVTQLLLDRELLIPSISADKKVRADRSERLPGMGNTRCYRFSPNIASIEL